MSNFLVTGGAGFIGSHITERLIKEGHNVKIFDNFSSGKLKNLEGFLDKVETIEGDIRNYDLLVKSLKGVEYVYHEAAIASVQASINNPYVTSDVNVSGTLCVLESACKAEVKRVIFASSAAIYGDSEILPKKEDMMPEPLSPYAIHKLSSEHYQKVFNKLYGIETVSLRYFNVYGPKQNPSSNYSGVISKILNRIKEGYPPIIFGDGEQTRDFIYIDDIVEANYLAAFSQKVGNGEVINVATGAQVSINELVGTIKNIVGIDITVNFEEKRKGDILKSVADINLAKNLLGYSPQVGFEDGLRKLIEYENK